MAIDRGLQFHIRIEESTWIRADEALFTKVISNVVGNAIKYTNEDGNIWVGVYKRGEEIIFWIENETESIDEKEIPKLCDAFYRIDKSRNTYIDGYIAPDLKIQDVEVHITKEMVLMDIGMISGILIIAVLVAGITIMKKRPKQILSEMS